MFSDKIKRLESLENKANRYAWKLKNVGDSYKLWYEMHPEWKRLYDEVREEYPEQYEQYRKQNGLAKNYNFSDVIA